MAETPSPAAILRRLARVAESKFSGVVFRTANPRYSSEVDMLSGLGAAKFGGRWNPKGIAAIYCSMTPEAALAETFAVQRYYGWRDQGALPRIIVAIEVELSGVLDLTEGSVRQRLRVSADTLLETDWRSDVAKGQESLTQRIGFAAATQFEAIRVWSATDGKTPNLVIFPQNLRPNSKLTMLK